MCVSVGEDDQGNATPEMLSPYLPIPRKRMPKRGWGIGIGELMEGVAFQGRIKERDCYCVDTDC